MIQIEQVSYSYPQSSAPALRELSLEIAEGEFLLVCGPSGSGKSTLLRLINGLVPHFYGGQFSGHVAVFGRDILRHQPRELADLVGFVFQDPEAQMVVEVVEDELAFAMENLALPEPIMRRRIEEVLDQLAIAELRQRRLSTLSGGERQRVAIAAALTAQPRVLVLDEPTSQLDPHGAEEVLTALQKLNADLGITVVLSEHRLERVVQYADRIAYFAPEGLLVGAPRAILAQPVLAPPLQELGRQLGWSPLPLTIKEGRSHARQLQPPEAPPAPPAAPLPSPPALAVEKLSLHYGDREALYQVSLSVPPASILALMGRNGSGKSSLLRAIAGLAKPTSGHIRIFGQAAGPLEARAKQLAYLPQDPRSLLFHDELHQELSFTLRARGLPIDPAQIAATLAELGLSAAAMRYPRDLSGGEAQRAALAALLVADPPLILLDEPTRGLDYAAKAALAALLRARRNRGACVILATHDVELVAALADHVAILGDGELIVHGPTTTVLHASLHFSPQIAKLFPQTGWLSVADALRGLG